MYRPFEAADGIRLIVLQPGSGNDAVNWHLEYTSLSEYRTYDALSYMWGDCKDLVEAYVHGQPTRITRNLWSALLHLRSPSNTCVLWIDAICIDQSNIHERNHQIHLMGDIYRKARTVLLWLGPESKTSGIAMRWIHRCNPQFQNAGQTAQRQTLGWKALEQLCARDYWNRVWIVQEVVLASRLILHCGSSKADWKGLVNILIQYDQFSTANSCSAIASRVERSLPATLTRLRAWKGFKECALLPLMEMTSDSKSTDPRDKVYGLLGLATDGHDFRQIIDYSKTLREMYQSLWHSFIASTSPRAYSPISDSFKRILKNTPFQQDLEIPCGGEDHGELFVLGRCIGKIIYAGQPWSTSDTRKIWVLKMAELHARGYPVKSNFDTFKIAFRKLGISLTDPFAPGQRKFKYSPVSPTNTSFDAAFSSPNSESSQEISIPCTDLLDNYVIIIGSGGHLAITMALARVDDRIYQFQNREVTMIARYWRDAGKERQAMVCSALLPWRCDGEQICDAPHGGTVARFSVVQEEVNSGDLEETQILNDHRRMNMLSQRKLWEYKTTCSQL